ncbi:MAG: PKD domain-containing protein, partial [Bacteroidota bacterium]
MRKIYLIVLLFLSALGIRAQNCAYTAIAAPGTNGVYSFYPDSLYSPSTTIFNWTINGTYIPNTYIASYQFSGPGAYAVCVDYITLLGTPICSYCDTVVVTGPAPNCPFTILTNPGSLLVDFNVTVPTGQYATWDFGDGGIGFGSTPWHTYNQGGTYAVCMELRDTFTQALTCTTCQSFTLQNGPPTCSISSFPDSMNPMMMYFYAAGTNPASSIIWDFGDGSAPALGAFTNHTYATNGVYVVCYQETDSSGSLICTSCLSIAVSPAGNCTINAVNLQGPTFSFSVPSPLPSGQFAIWDYGDGGSGYGQSVVHSYNAAGNYSVCVTISDSMGMVSCSSCTTITNSFNPSGNCNIQFFQLQPNSYAFSVPAYPGATGYLWNFGDGTTGSGTNVQHTYSASGVYVVSISVTGGGAVLCNSVVTVIVNNIFPTCSAYFVSSSQSLTGYFIDLSSNTSPATAYTWNFGDGNTSTLRFPQHTYAQRGTYNVCLTIADSNCADTYCQAIIVDTQVVIPGGCQAFFATVQLAPYQLAVVNLSNGQMPLTYSWDFGDGSTSTLPFPSHQYANIGSYLLCLSIADANGCVDTYCDTLSVDSMGNVFRSMTGFTINVVSPATLTGVTDAPSTARFSGYPNPATERFYIERPVSTPALYRIMTLQGAVLLEGSLTEKRSMITLTGFSSGTY